MTDQGGNQNRRNLKQRTKFRNQLKNLDQLNQMNQSQPKWTWHQIFTFSLIFIQQLGITGYSHRWQTPQCQFFIFIFIFILGP